MGKRNEKPKGGKYLNAAGKARALRWGRWLALLKPALFALAALIALVASTAAWFANNSKVNGDGIKMEVEALPNLIIDEDSAVIVTINEDLEMHKSVTFQDGVSLLRPATHDSGIAGTRLKFVSNSIDVSPSTGYSKSGEALQFEAVSADDTRYYLEHTVYIASAGAPMNISSLNATLAYSTTPETEYAHFKAASVDFYLDDTYTCTLNLVPGTNTASIAGSGSIPWNMDTSGAAKYWKVTMRFYFDGALQNTETGNAYVHSDSLTTADIALKVLFEAVPSEG